MKIYHILIILNIVSFMLMGLDKLFAKLHLRRISEKMLLFVGFLGAFGAVAGMLLFRHKTRKLKFQILFSVFLVANILIYIYLYYGGYL